MEESLLRWKGRIGALKGGALFILILLAIFLFPAIKNLNIALKNGTESQAVTVMQLVNGQVEQDIYVSVSGLASYELAYFETEDNITKSIVYPLIDQETGVVFFVRTTNIELRDDPDTNVTVIGLTDIPSTELKDAILADISVINDAGFQTTAEMIIQEGKKPGGLLLQLLILGSMGFMGLLSIVTFFFPSTVFGPFPVQPIESNAVISKAVKATGRFQQVKTMEPLTFGRARRRFEKSVANLFVTNDRKFGIYIHFIHTTRVYGIRVAKQETDWMILMDPSQVIAIEPGKIYGWRDQWALSVHHKDADGKEQTAYVSFENSASQTSFINFLREQGFPVSSGQYAVIGQARS